MSREASLHVPPKPPGKQQRHCKLLAGLALKLQLLALVVQRERVRQGLFPLADVAAATLTVLTAG